MPVVAPDAEHLDPELLELFIEEAKEEIASIKRNLPQWADSPDDMETLITVRRSFHTLKGSGRMVGAERIGEYCWSVENLLNRLINRTLTRTPPMVRFILEAAAVVPELVEQLESGREPESDVNLLIAKANAFAEGDPNAGVLTLSRPDEADQAEQAPALEMDPVLLDIFAKETDGHLQVISEFIAACEGHRPPFHVTDRLHRACHTLHGSANMANVERGIAVAGALNRYVRRAYDYNIGFDAAGTDVLRAAADAIRSIVADINQPERHRADFADLIAHLTALTDSIEAPAPEDKAAEPAAAEQETGRHEQQPEAEQPGEGEYDAEIAGIFSEEAAEILEEADRVLALWSKDKSSREHAEELKRHLHTLKGGARMAGILPMGNLSHELETLLIGIDEGRIPASPELDALLQQSIDELHRMRDSVTTGKRMTPATELEQVIHRINGGDVSAAAAFYAAPTDTTVEEAISEDSVSVEFTSEPEESVSMVIVEPDEIAPVEAPVPPVAGVEAERVAHIDHDVRSAGAETPAADAAAAEQPPPAAEDLRWEQEASADKEPEPEPESEPESAPFAEPPEVIIEPESRRRDRQAAAGDSRQEFARIDAELLEDLLNAAGEISIYHSRLSQQVSSIEFHIEELEQTVSRLRQQLRKLEIETEAQIMHGHQETFIARDFDPLEMDRYSNIQQLSRALAESANDLGSLKDLLRSLTSEAETLLVQQSRVTAELQDGLMRTRMVPFQRHVPRLTRLVRQTAADVGKRAELAVEGASGELDRQVLDKMLPPFEHMMRNAVIHGIEKPNARQKKG
ncbi:MAG TPA: Hpt domain-containing protein, partial [Woeseiaceae bacterium]